MTLNQSRGGLRRIYNHGTKKFKTRDSSLKGEGKPSRGGSGLPKKNFVDVLSNIRGKINGGIKGERTVLVEVGRRGEDSAQPSHSN